MVKIKKKNFEWRFHVQAREVKLGLKSLNQSRSQIQLHLDLSRLGTGQDKLPKCKLILNINLSSHHSHKRENFPDFPRTFKLFE